MKQTVNTTLMRAVGFVLLLAALISALAQGWNKPDQATCRFIGDTTGPCAPPNYTLALVLACVGLGLFVVSLFIRERH